MFRFTPKSFEIDQGDKIVVREPNPIQDLESLLEFFSQLPDESKNTLRCRANDLVYLRARLDKMDGQAHWRLIAQLNGRIVGDATMDREPFSWTHHVAHIRTVIHPDFSSRGIDELLLSRLVEIGSKAGVERLCVDLLAGDDERLKMLEQMGFVHELTRHNYAKDSTGHLRDVIVMTNEISDVWQRLADYFHELDFPRPGLFEGQ